jgi:radical SAM-linked protein
VRLSAIEDFIGRGDRRLAPVIEAAWRAGAGLDAWFESAERSYAAWTGAIEAAGLGGRYRQLELGAWSAVEAMEAADLEAFCRQSLPWDHIDAGLDKRWLADDLQRALEATVVPDCSFEGCSSCGVCGPELGHNVVIAPPAIPPALPQRAPASERVCRLRIGFAKTGSLALISHLDLLRLLERALRRTGLPVSFTGGFHPLPRLQVALALPLGVEGTGEWLDLEFTQPVEPAAVRARLQAELPPGLQLLSAAVVPTFGPSLSQELAAAHWRFALRAEDGPALDPQACDAAIAALLAAPVLSWHDTDKKGRPRQRDCRPELQDLRLVAPGADPEAPAAPGELVLELEAAIDGAGRSLRPSQVAHWLAKHLGREPALGSQCRRALLLREPMPAEQP